MKAIIMPPEALGVTSVAPGVFIGGDGAVLLSSKDTGDTRTPRILAERYPVRGFSSGLRRIAGSV